MTAAGTFEEGSSTLQLKTDQDHQRLTGVRSRLLAAREERARPARDDKVVAAWNGWLIDSLVQSAMIFDRPDWLTMAIEAAEAIWALHWRHGRLRRASRAGVVGTAPGILEDYGVFAQACVRIAAVRAEPVWLDRAREPAEVIMVEFDDDASGFFDTAADAEQLYTRPQDPTDNATPSGLSAAIHALALLGELTGESRTPSGRTGGSRCRRAGRSGAAVRRLVAGRCDQPDTVAYTGADRDRGARRPGSGRPGAGRPPPGPGRLGDHRRRT